MQKVTYINAYGESIVFGGEPPVLLRSVSGLSRPDAKIISTQGAYQGGATMHRMQLPTRSIQLQFDFLPQESREALYRQRMQVERVLSSGRCMRNGKVGLLVYENDAGRWQADAVPDGTVTYGKRFQNGAAVNKINFLCPNPYLLDSAKSIVQMRMGGGGFTLPTELPIRLGARKFRVSLINNGTAETPVTITIHGTGETPKLINHTTGAQLIISRVIANGERLVIHTDPSALSCVLHGVDGTTEDAFGYLDPSVAMSAFTLIPGTNDVEYMPSVVSTQSCVEIEWRGCYEGV